MRGAVIDQSERKRWGHGLVRLLALLAVALHVFTISGHVHVPQFGPAAAQHAASHDAGRVWGAQSGVLAAQAAAHIQHTLSGPTDPAPCVFCQTLASAGAGIAPNAPMLALWLGVAALIAALLGQRQVVLQRLTIWRSRAPPHRL